jgi:hypothetical protein
MTHSKLNSIKIKSFATSICKCNKIGAKTSEVNQILREIEITNDIQRRIEKANATELKSFRLWLEMEDAA